jgi:Carboxypeptidase regulatory-like domain/TonB dependent receptor/TonB-dependent Receptor Plug Domain
MPGMKSHTLSTRRGTNCKRMRARLHRRMRKETLGSFMALVLWGSPGLIPLRANAQVSDGILSGTITDQSGAVMPNARVTVTDQRTGATRAVTADTQGCYTLPNLPPDTYEMTVSAPAFTTQVRTGVTLTVGAKLVLNVAMKAGSPTEVVRMTAAESLASQASSAVSGTVSSSTVRESPLNGRDWTQLATLQAGVTGVQTGSAQGGGNTSRGFGAAMSISGARPDQNNFRLDGISINDYSNGAPGSVLGDNLGVDAVEQFSVLGSNYPAEYGRTSGGVINAVTRSGTNAWHGSVYEFLRNSALDARNFFDREIPPFKRNQFGASGGGPIQKDRTFFFGDYEGLRQSLGVTQVDTVPSTAARNGQLSTGLVTVDSAGARFLQAFYPLPNGPLLGKGDTGIYTFAGQQVTHENYFTARIDRKFSEKDSVTGTYMRDNSKIVQPNAFDSLLSNVVSGRQLVTLREQHIFNPRFLNAVRLGFNRAVGIDGGITRILNPSLVDPSFAFTPGQFVGTIQGVPGLTNMPDAPSAQNPGSLSGSRSLYWNSYQGGDDTLVTRGIHALQFGVVVERMQDNAIDFGTTNGNFRFSSLSDLLTNRPRTFSGIIPGPDITYGTRQTLFGTYVQDDIQARQNLTLNLGLRYEMTTVPAEAHNKISNLRRLTDAQPRLGSPYFLNPTLYNFEPRVGFAWRPSTNSKTFLRAGFGIFDVLPLPYELRNITLNPIPFARQLSGVVLPGSFPTGAYQLLASSSTAFRASYVEHSPKRSYVMQWNLSMARQLSSDLVATIGYVGSRGVHQPFRIDNIDMVLPTLTPAGYLFPPVAASQTLNPNFGRVTAMLWQANSFYDALQVDLAKRVSHGVEFHAAYTWGKSLDTLSATVSDDNYPNGIFNPLFFDQRTTRGLSDFNVSQDFVVSYTWELPNPTLRSKAASWGLDGWQLGGIYKASSGQPFTPLLGGDPQGTKLDETSEPPNLIAGPGCDTLANIGNPNHYIKTQCLASPNPPNLRGNLGRNTVIGPGLSKFDFSVFKNNHVRRISENFNVQFRAEFFNVFNRANFSSPTDNLNVFDQSGNPVPSAGLITSTQTPAREIQFALKIIW